MSLVSSLDCKTWQCDRKTAARELGRSLGLGWIVFPSPEIHQIIDDMLLTLQPRSKNGRVLKLPTPIVIDAQPDQMSDCNLLVNPFRSCFMCTVPVTRRHDGDTLVKKRLYHSRLAVPRCPGKGALVVSLGVRVCFMLP